MRETEREMLRLRLSVDLKCPRHQSRQYPTIDVRCHLCVCLSGIAEAARALEREITAQSGYGAEVRWKNSRRSAPGKGRREARPLPGSPPAAR